MTPSWIGEFSGGRNDSVKKMTVLWPSYAGSGGLVSSLAICSTISRNGCDTPSGQVTALGLHACAAALIDFPISSMVMSQKPLV